MVQCLQHYNIICQFSVPYVFIVYVTCIEFIIIHYHFFPLVLNTKNVQSHYIPEIIYYIFLGLQLTIIFIIY